MISKYTGIAVQSLIFASIYFYIKEYKYTPSLFIQFMIFYIFIQGLGESFGVNNSVITLLFISRIISVYLDSCEDKHGNNKSSESSKEDSHLITNS